MMMLACVTGSVLISKTSFMCRRGSDDGRNVKKGRGGGSKESVGEARMRGRNQGQWRRLTATASPWFLVKGENLVVREVSSTKEITFYRSTKWTKDRPTMFP